jgi:hypothetical protein
LPTFPSPDLNRPGGMMFVREIKKKKKKKKRK